MIAKLTGIIDSIGDAFVVVDVSGVGYLVFASGRTLDALPSVGDPVSLLIETHIREDHIHLFGFMEAQEREMYKILLGVQGVGAKVGLGILGALSPSAIQTAIASGDKAAITLAPGVGPKLAVRILTELKDKVGSFGFEMPSHSNTLSKASGASSDFSDAVSALQNLGYSTSEAHTAVIKGQNGLGSDAKVEALIGFGLKELSK